MTGEGWALIGVAVTNGVFAVIVARMTKKTKDTVVEVKHEFNSRMDQRLAVDKELSEALGKLKFQEGKAEGIKEEKEKGEGESR